MRSAQGEKLMDDTIRKAVSSDTARINELFIQLLQSVYQREDVHGYENGYLDKFFQTDDNLIYVAEAGSQVIAYLSIEEHQEEGGFLYLDDFCVDKAWRGHGIGTRLLSMADNYAAEHHFHRIVLHVESTNTRARTLYKNNGYAKYQEINGRIKMIKEVQCAYRAG